MLRCSELGLNSPDVLDQFTIGMVYDMLTERANDQEKYPLKGTGNDIKAFFGGF